MLFYPRNFLWKRVYSGFVNGVSLCIDPYSALADNGVTVNRKTEANGIVNIKKP